MADQALANRIRQLRKERSLTLDALAREAGIGRRTLINYETGATSPPLDAAASLAGVLGVTIDELAGAVARNLPDLVLVLDGRQYESWEVKRGRAAQVDAVVLYQVKAGSLDDLGLPSVGPAEAEASGSERRRGRDRRRRSPAA